MCSLVSTQLAASNPASWAEAAAVRLWTALAAFTPSTAPSLSSGQSRCPLFLNLKSRIEKQRSYIQQFWQHLLASQLQATTAHASSSQRQKLVPFTCNYTVLTFSKNAFAFPLAAFSTGSQKGKEQSKVSSGRMAVVAAAGLTSRNRHIKGETLINSFRGVQENLQSPG